MFTESDGEQKTEVYRVGDKIIVNLDGVELEFTEYDAVAIWSQFIKEYPEKVEEFIREIRESRKLNY